MPQGLIGIQILVVDDDADSREVLAHILGLEGAAVTTASTADEALGQLAKVDIVLTDVAIPDHDGLWLLEQVKQQPRPVPVIAISGYDESQEPRLAAFAGTFLKPLDMERVCAEIRAVLGRRAPR
jgi:CheY-like chemotaxis protein